MTLPALPAQGSSDWYAYGQALDNAVRTGGGGSSSGTATGWVVVGGVGDGSADDTAAVAAAFSAVPAGGTVIFPAGKSFKVSSVTMPARAVNVIAHGATIVTSTGGSFAFVQSQRFRTSWFGGTFVGAGSGFKLNLAPSADQSYDFSFNNVSFILPGDQIALHFIGGREGTVTNCYFETCTGIQLRETVNTHIIGCQFKNCTQGVYGDGATGSAYNAGVMLDGCTMLGCAIGVHTVGHDWTTINNCMIDYCDSPVQLVNANVAVVSGSYFSNRETATTAPPVIQVVSDGAQGGNACQHVRIHNCSIICNVASFPQQAIGIQYRGGVTWASVTSSSIHFWRKYGIQVVDTSTYLKITGNDMVRVGTETGAASVQGSGGNDSTWLIADNYLSVPIANTISPVTRSNFT